MIFQNKNLHNSNLGISIVNGKSMSFGFKSILHYISVPSQMYDFIALVIKYDKYGNGSAAITASPIVSVDRLLTWNPHKLLWTPC